MKFSENWLREWVDPPLDSEQLAARLTMAGLEVDALLPVAKALANVVVGEVIATAKHPDADKLNVCSVSDGAQQYQVVCGAPNVRPGLRIPFARVGATLGADFTIKQAKLRGVESSGMLCSADELGLADDADGLLELPVDAPIGESISTYLGLDDHTIEIGLTPNRGDCLGIAGIARDLAAITGAELRLEVNPAPVAPTIDDTLSVELRAPQACPRYVGRIVKGVDLSRPSPLWLQEKLRRSDIRSIDPVVDVTNLVLMELGQPMHAFDLSAIEGGIVVRMADPDEKLVLLDDSEIALGADNLVIADHQKGLALAGIMGGAHSAVGADTQDIFLESAFFAPQSMAGKARALGMHTDACHRYERGVDFALQNRAIERATALLLEIVGGEAGPVLEAVADDMLPQLTEILLRRQRLDAVLGLQVPDGEVERILVALGMRPEVDPQGWRVAPPSWRFDIRIEADLCEEIARVVGYERIPTRVQPAAVPLRAQPEARLRLTQLRRRLTSLGYQEAITYSFVEPSIQQLLDPDRLPVPVANPISADMAVMRTTLLAGLVKAVQFNQHRQQRRVRLFESGLRFIKDEEGLSQRMALAAIASGDRTPEGWSLPSQMIDFFDIKGDLELVLGIQDGNVDDRFEVVEHPALHPGQSAALVREGQQIGVVGALHPRIVDALDLQGPIYVFEVDLAHSCERNLPKFKALSKFPEVRRDIAVIVAEEVSAKQLLQAAQAVVGNAVKDLNVFDIYRGQGVDSNSKSVAISVHMQHAERTLNDEEVNGEIATIVAALERECGAVLRE